LSSALPKRLRQLRLDLYENSIGDEGASALAARLPLQELWLDLTSNQIGDEGASSLAAALAKLPLRVLQLDLGGNRIRDDGVRAVAAAVGQLPQLQKLALGLGNNGLSPKVKEELRGQLEALSIPEKEIGIHI